MKTKTMTEGNAFFLILQFALPLMVGNVFQELYTITDTIVVGRFLGINALAAIGAGGWITWMLLSTVAGLTQGFSVSAAQAFGAGNKEELNKYMGNSIVLSAIICVVLTAVGEAFIAPLLRLLGTPKEIFKDAVTYVGLFYAGCPILLAYNYAAAHLRALGNSSAPLKAMIIASVVNISLDIVFVGPFGWGIKGAIFATLIAQMVSALYALGTLFKIDIVSLKKRDFKLKVSVARKQLYMGIPMAFQNIIISVGGIIVQFVVNRYGITYIAGFTATNRLYGLIETAAITYGYAITTYVGQNIGAGKLDRIKTGMRSGIVLAVITSIIIAVAMICCGNNILGLFITGDPHKAQATMIVAERYLFIMLVNLPILYLLHIMKAAVVGFGNSTFAVLSSVAELALRVVASLVLPIYFGEMNLFFAEPLAWLAAWLVLMPGYFYCRNNARRALLEK